MSLTLTAEIHSAFCSVLNCRHSLRTLGVIHSAAYAGDDKVARAAAARATDESMLWYGRGREVMKRRTPLKVRFGHLLGFILGRSHLLGLILIYFIQRSLAI